MSVDCNNPDKLPASLPVPVLSLREYVCSGQWPTSSMKHRTEFQHHPPNGDSIHDCIALTPHPPLYLSFLASRDYAVPTNRKKNLSASLSMHLVPATVLQHPPFPYVLHPYSSEPPSPVLCVLAHIHSSVDQYPFAAGVSANPVPYPFCAIHQCQLHNLRFLSYSVLHEALSAASISPASPRPAVVPIVAPPFAAFPQMPFALYPLRNETAP